MNVISLTCKAPFVEVTDVSKSFSAHRGGPVLDDVNLTVRAREFVAIIGPSGCGKSTLLHLIAGLAQATSGRVELADGARIAYVFQDARLLPWRTVRRNVAYGLERIGLNREQVGARVQSSLALVSLNEGHGDKYPHQLSGGMQQRVALARGLAIEPQLLLLDEPFGSLDALTRSYLQDELLGIVRRLQTTALLVTHDIDEALLLADRVVAMSSRPGRIKAEVVTPFGSDRTMDRVVAHPDYAQIRTRLRRLLMPEVEAGSAAN